MLAGFIISSKTILSLNLNFSSYKSIWMMLKVKPDVTQWSMDSEKLKMECVSFPTYKEDNKSYFAVLFT
jgi:hypothetical protein